MSKLAEFCSTYYSEVLNGNLLAIDPSSGSTSSMPGYAIYRCGILVDSGFIQLTANTRLHQRLHQLMECLRVDFLEAESIDVVAVEYIAMKNYKGSGTRHSAVSLLPLQRSVGVVQAVFGGLPVIEVAPISWKKYAEPDQVKTDEFDAIGIGRCVVEVSKLEQDKIATKSKLKKKRK